jgi:hypothetical protein
LEALFDIGRHIIAKTAGMAALSKKIEFDRHPIRKVAALSEFHNQTTFNSNPCKIQQIFVWLMPSKIIFHR